MLAMELRHRDYFQEESQVIFSSEYRRIEQRITVGPLVIRSKPGSPCLMAE